MGNKKWAGSRVGHDGKVHKGKQVWLSKPVLIWLLSGATICQMEVGVRENLGVEQWCRRQVPAPSLSFLGAGEGR